MKMDNTYAIKRTSVPAFDAILGCSIPVLDHGFVRPIDYMGDDAAVVQMARVSYGEGTKKVSDDAGLIRYLMRHHHTSPFEGNEIKLHVKLPVFVARQWIRHRTANVNEYSARYSILDSEFYIPEADVMMKQSKDNKQGRAEVLDPEVAEIVRRILIHDAATAYRHYEDMTHSSVDLTRELARINLPVNIYTQWYWKTDLHNLLHFLRLRADSHAQYEIRVYAEAIMQLVAVWCPLVLNAAKDYIFGAETFSRMEMEVLRHIISNLHPNYFNSYVERLEAEGASKREVKEFIAKLKGE